MLDLSTLTPKVTTFVPYHDAVPKRTWQLPPQDRPFIAWDGEGENLDGDDRPQHYTLFGSSDTGIEPLVADSHLHTFTILDYILAIGERNPTAFHVSYSFNYDANQIIRSLHENVILQLHKTGKIALRLRGERYFIHYLPGKWFSVSKYKRGYDKQTNRHAKTTVRIFDIFSFFGTSFIKAYSDIVGAVSGVVEAGKAARGDFANRSKEFILEYWRDEIQKLRELAEALRERMYGAELYIREWHGPGALASFVNRKHNIKQHMAISPDAVREAARYAYAGGRFEIFQLGRTVGPIYSMDINSAYPHGIRQLPSLSAGRWIHVNRPERLARFGVYRVRINPRMGGSFLERAPGPLFHRDKMGNISFPWIGEGWYWSPEVRTALKLGSQITVEEGWEYVDWQGSERPFAFVEEAYELRREWKAVGNASQLALKLMMNSLYGKMAQRVGWDEERRSAPKWHQLEWAGWVTSNCRAMLWDVMSKLSPGAVIAVETDGIYTTQHPATVLGPGYGHRRTDALAGSTVHSLHAVADQDLKSSTELGGWELEQYDEILYVQSGLAWLRRGDKWVCKRRGLDARTFELDDCRRYLRTLGPGGDWEPYTGSTTRFIGMGAALASSQPTKSRLGLWETAVREIRPGQNGKRVHIPTQCRACNDGHTAWEASHDMMVRSRAYREPMSHPHDIPWENGDLGYEWRNVDEFGRRAA